MRWLGWEDPCFEGIHLLEKGWIFRGQDGQDTNKVREVMSSNLRSGVWIGIFEVAKVLPFCMCYPDLHHDLGDIRYTKRYLIYNFF